MVQTVAECSTMQVVAQSTMEVVEHSTMEVAECTTQVVAITAAEEAVVDTDQLLNSSIIHLIDC